MKKFLFIFILLSSLQIKTMEKAKSGIFHLGAIVTALTINDTNKCFVVPYDDYQGNGFGQLDALANYMLDEQWKNFSKFSTLKRRLAVCAPLLEKEFPNLKQWSLELKDIYEGITNNSELNINELLFNINAAQFKISERNIFADNYFKKVPRFKDQTIFQVDDEGDLYKYDLDERLKNYDGFVIIERDNSNY